MARVAITFTGPSVERLTVKKEDFAALLQDYGVTEIVLAPREGPCRLAIAELEKAEEAVEKLNGSAWKGTTIEVSLSRSREERPSFRASDYKLIT